MYDYTYIYVTMLKSVRVATPSPIPVAGPTSPAAAAMSPQEPMSIYLTPMPPRVSRELEHRGYVEIPGRTRGETRAMRAAS